MAIFLRVSATILGAVLLLGGLAVVRPASLAVLGLDFGELEQSLRILDSERQRRLDLNAACEKVAQRLEDKAKIGRAVFQRRCTLLEAAAQMRALLDAAPADTWKGLRCSEQGATDHERVCRHVIAWAGATPVGEEGKLYAELQRLELELHELQERGILSDPQGDLSPAAAAAVLWETHR